MAGGDEELISDTLFVGMTRPTTIWGVPYGAFLAEAMLTVYIFLGSGNPLLLGVFAPMHAILYIISANDPGIFDSIRVWAITFLRCRNRDFWGAASFSPVSTRKRKN